jgi:ribosomal protein S18 acetylase RimI-like enzyme
MEDFTIPPEKHLEAVLQMDGFTVIVALQDGKVVGGLTAHTLQQYYTTLPQLYIYDVGVTPSFHRQGIGKALMETICSYAKENGFENLYVEAELEDDHAVEFYRSTGGKETKVVMFTYQP